MIVGGDSGFANLAGRQLADAGQSIAFGHQRLVEAVNGARRAALQPTNLSMSLPGTFRTRRSAEAKSGHWA